MLWPAISGGRSERRMLCGLAVACPEQSSSFAFMGNVADIDQSVWPVLSIDATTNQPIDVPVWTRHRTRWRWSGTVNLAERASTRRANPEQDGFIADAYPDDGRLPALLVGCTTTLTLDLPTLTLPS